MDEANSRSLSFVETDASVLLDLVRGLAAMLVLGEHWRNLLFLDYPQVTAHRALLLLPYLITSGGHQAVVIFFVLSGYLISGSIFRSLAGGQWSWRAYATHRIVRLWLVLLPGLMLCELWDRLGIFLRRAPLTYSGHVQDHMVGNVASVLGARIFFGNAVFLQTIRLPTLGSDGALWSLANEFWYYVLFPLGLFVFLPKSKIWVRAVCGVLFLAIAWFVGHAILFAFPIWLVGTALALVKPPRLGRGVRWLAALLYVPLVYFFAKYHGPGADQTDYVLAIATFFLLWIMLSARQEANSKSAAVKASRGLSRFSYTLYVAHTPFLLFLTSLAVGDARWTPTAGHILAGCGLLVAALGFSYAVAWITEFRTDAVRRWVERKLGIASKPWRNAHEAAMAQQT